MKKPFFSIIIPTYNRNIQLKSCLHSLTCLNYSPPNFEVIVVNDGGEIQLPALNARSITIDINDSGLGVLTKFDFPNVYKPKGSDGNAIYIIGFLVAGVLGYVLNTRKKTKG